MLWPLMQVLNQYVHNWSVWSSQGFLKTCCILGDSAVLHFELDVHSRFCFIFCLQHIGRGWYPLPLGDCCLIFLLQSTAKKTTLGSRLWSKRPCLCLSFDYALSHFQVTDGAEAVTVYWSKLYSRLSNTDFFYLFIYF